MADGQQGFSSFDDLDKFLKQKPAVSSQQPAPLAQPPTQKQETGGGFKDFSDLDKFVSETDRKKKQPPPPKETISAYKPSFARRLEDWVDAFAREHRPGTDIQGAFDPKIQEEQKSFAKMMAGPITGVPDVLAGTFRLFTGEKRTGEEKYPRVAAAGEMAGGIFNSLLWVAPQGKLAAGPAGFLSSEALPFFIGIMAGGSLANKVGEKLGVPPEVSETAIDILLLGSQARSMFKSRKMIEHGITAEKTEAAVQEALEAEKAKSPKPEAIQDIQTRIADGSQLLR